VTLTVRGYVKLPPHTTGGGFDRGDVHAATRRLFIAHTANESLGLQTHTGSVAFRNIQAQPLPVQAAHPQPAVVAPAVRA
jgi:hypothetical protein